MDGLRALTDPVLRDRTAHLRRKGPAVGANWREQIDLILISRLRLDHFDAPSLNMLDKNTPVVAPRRNAPPIERAGYALEGARKVYFAGDTDLFDEMRDLNAGLDAALLPV